MASLGKGSLVSDEHGGPVAQSIRLPIERSDCKTILTLTFVL